MFPLRIRMQRICHRTLNNGTYRSILNLSRLISGRNYRVKTSQILNVRNLSDSRSGKVIDSFDEAQRENILNTFNSHSEEELYELPVLPKPTARNIVEYRELHGPFRELSEITKVGGLGSALLEKLSHSIINGERKKKKAAKLTAGTDAVTPGLILDQVRNVQSVVSYQIYGNRVVWIHMNKFLELLDWHSGSLLDTESVKYEHHVYQAKIRAVIDQFPQSSLYVSEERLMMMNHARQMGSLLRDARTEAIATTLLNQSYDDTGVHKVFKMKSTVVGKYFKLLVAGERISGRDVVKSILNSKMELAHELLIPPSFVSWYFGKTAKEKDEIASTLLTAIAFFKKVIKEKTSDRTATVSPGEHEVSDSDTETNV